MGDTLVLAYHAVAEAWPSSLAVTPAAIEEQTRLLLDGGYRPATITDAVLNAGSDEDVFAVTFDDGYRSVVDLAMPVLSRLGVPATVFVPTRFLADPRPMSWPGIDGWIGSPYEDQLRPISWDDAATLVDAGWEIGSHTHTHPHLTKLDDHSLAFELRASREACEQALGRPCSSIAYPFGDFDDRVAAAAATAGYEVGAGMPGRYRRVHPLGWPRVGVYPVDTISRFRAKVSPMVRRLRAGQAWELAGQVRRRVRR